MADRIEKWNHFKTKRAAHVLARRGSLLTPFPNTFSFTRRSGSSHRRVGTWSGEPSDDVEAQTSAPMAHAHTVPNSSSDRRGGVAASDYDEDKPAHSRTSEPGSSRTAAHDSEGGHHATGVDGYAPATLTRSRTTLSGRGASGAPVAKSTDDALDAEKSDDAAAKRGWYKEVPHKVPFTVRNQIQRTLLNSWLNIAILAAPVGIAVNYVPGVSRIAVFVINFIAIIPLASLLGFATEEIALRTGETLGGLLNATFGNAVELIVAILALVKNEYKIVQTSLIGSILSNLLLVMGMCFFFGGVGRSHQNFNETVAQTAASMLALAVASVIIPTVFDANTSVDVAPLSRGTAVLLLFVYAGYLYFQLHTHADIFSLESEKVPRKKASRDQLPDGAVSQGLVGGAAGLMGAQVLSRHEDNEAMRRTVVTPPAPPPEEPEEPQLHFLVAIGTLAASTVVIAFCAEYMVDSISAVTAGGGISEEFIGLILLPIVGNAAEHLTAVTVACKDKMDLAIGVAVGSSMQVALLIIPLLVVLGWILGKDQMTLSFDTFQVAVLFVSVLLVNYLIGDGKSHWLEGQMLMILYLIIAVCSWYYPATGVAG